MNIEMITARKEIEDSNNPKNRLLNIVGASSSKGIDAIIIPNSNKLFGCYGMKFDAPICRRLIANEIIMKFINSICCDIMLFSFDTDLKLYVDGANYFIDSDITAIVLDIYTNILNSAGHIGDDGEHIIDLKTDLIGTHYDVNLLIGNCIGDERPMLSTPKSTVNSLGHGTFYSGAGNPVTSPIYSIHTEISGEPSNRQFYLYENGKQIFYSADVNNNVKNGKCTHYVNKTIIRYETECGLDIERTIFILPKQLDIPNSVEVQSIQIYNHSGRNRQLKIVCTGTFGLNMPASVNSDVLYCGITWESGILKVDGSPIALCPNPYPKYQKRCRKFASILVDGEPMDNYTTNYGDFIGNGSLSFPQNGNLMLNIPQTKFVSFFAMDKSFCLNDDDYVYIDEFTGVTNRGTGTESEEDYKFEMSVVNLFNKFRKHSSVLDSLWETEEFTNKYNRFLQIHSGNKLFDSYVNNNLPFQVYYQSYFSRSISWSQRAVRKIGFREVQDMFPAMYYMIYMGNTSLVKKMLRMWLKNVYRMGYASHNFYIEPEDPGKCSDDGLWLVQAVSRYVQLSGDTQFLNEDTPIYDSECTRTVLQTLLDIVTYSGSISVGPHGFPLLDASDWNDGLKADPDFIDGPTKEKLYLEQISNGGTYGDRFISTHTESVMNAFLLKVAYDGIATITDGDIHNKMVAMAEALSDKIKNTCWKDNFYIRLISGNIDDDWYMGAKGDGFSCDESIDGTYFLNSFTWSILSGIATDEQIETMLDVIKKYLLTDKGIRLCTPITLERLTKIDTFSAVYFYGDRENGGIFKHAEMMAAYAMLNAARKVKSKELSDRLLSCVYFLIDTVLPYKTLDNPFVKKGNPRFCTQYTNSISGEAVGPILTGTASWLTLTILNMLGIGESESQLIPKEFGEIKCGRIYDNMFPTIKI